MTLEPFGSYLGCAPVRLPTCDAYVPAAAQNEPFGGLTRPGCFKIGPTSFGRRAFGVDRATLISRLNSADAGRISNQVSARRINVMSASTY
jgi:hypothetical protein